MQEKYESSHVCHGLKFQLVHFYGELVMNLEEDYTRLPCCTMLYHVIPPYTSLYHVIPSYSILYRLIPCYTTVYHLIPSYTMLYHVVPCYTMLYHVTPWLHLRFLSGRPEIIPNHGGMTESHLQESVFKVLGWDPITVTVAWIYVVSWWWIKLRCLLYPYNPWECGIFTCWFLW